MSEHNSIVHMYCVFFIQTSIGGRLGCLQVSAIINDDAINIGVHRSL